MLGLQLPENFRQPFFAVSIKDFWQRWHISLSAWLRDYVYIPLGGNRRGRLRKYGNLLATFLVSGAWHAGMLTYLVWGALHGVFQIIGDATAGLRGSVVRRFGVGAQPASPGVSVPVCLLPGQRRLRVFPRSGPGRRLPVPAGDFVQPGACRLLGILEDRPDQPPGPASAAGRGCDRPGGGAASGQRRQFAPLGGGPAASGALDAVRGGPSSCSC